MSFILQDHHVTSSKKVDACAKLYPYPFPFQFQIRMEHNLCSAR